MSTVVLPGHMIDHKGRQVPLSIIPKHTLERDALVKQLFAEAKSFSDKKYDFYSAMFHAVENFQMEAATRHNVKIGGEKGHITLTSYDGHIQIVIDINRKIQFNEMLGASLEKAAKIVHKHAENGTPFIKSIANWLIDGWDVKNLPAFKLMMLVHANIDDQEWPEVRKMLEESYDFVAGNKCLNVYQIDQNGKHRLDI